MTESRKISLHIVRIISAMLIVLPGIRTATALDNNLQIGGTLVAEPCNIDSDVPLEVDFGTVIIKGLYSNIRTAPAPFIINLTECDISLGKDVTLLFRGNENLALPGLLAADAMAGIAIGIEQPDGKALPVNQMTPAYKLQNGTTSIALQAYVEAEPQTITDHSLVPGDFTATATIEVAYP